MNALKGVTSANAFRRDFSWPCATPSLVKTPFLIDGDDRLGFVQTVSDQIMQFLPALQLKRDQAQLGFGLFVLHWLGATAVTSRVSSNFCRLSSSRCASGRFTDCS